VNPTTHSQEQIEQLAYQFWEERGRPWGTPETDWFKAERELGVEAEGMLSRVAREIGSALGQAVALVTEPATQKGAS